jgi:hypothetical protein
MSTPNDNTRTFFPRTDRTAFLTLPGLVRRMHLCNDRMGALQPIHPVVYYQKPIYVRGGTHFGDVDTRRPELGASLRIQAALLACAYRHVVATHLDDNRATSALMLLYDAPVVHPGDPLRRVGTGGYFWIFYQKDTPLPKEAKEGNDDAPHVNPDGSNGRSKGPPPSLGLRMRHADPTEWIRLFCAAAHSPAAQMEPLRTGTEGRGSYATHHPFRQLLGMTSGTLADDIYGYLCDAGFKSDDPITACASFDVLTAEVATRARAAEQARQAGVHGERDILKYATDERAMPVFDYFQHPLDPASRVFFPTIAALEENHNIDGGPLYVVPRDLMDPTRLARVSLPHVGVDEDAAATAIAAYANSAGISLEEATALTRRYAGVEGLVAGHVLDVHSQMLACGSRIAQTLAESADDPVAIAMAWFRLSERLTGIMGQGRNALPPGIVALRDALDSFTARSSSGTLRVPPMTLAMYSEPSRGATTALPCMQTSVASFLSTISMVFGVRIRIVIILCAGIYASDSIPASARLVATVCFFGEPSSGKSTEVSTLHELLPDGTVRAVARDTTCSGTAKGSNDTGQRVDRDEVGEELGVTVTTGHEHKQNMSSRQYWRVAQAQNPRARAWRMKTSSSTRVATVGRMVSGDSSLADESHNSVHAAPEIWSTNARVGEVDLAAITRLMYTTVLGHDGIASSATRASGAGGGSAQNTVKSAIKAFTKRIYTELGLYGLAVTMGAPAPDVSAMHAFLQRMFEVAQRFSIMPAVTVRGVVRAARLSGCVAALRVVLDRRWRMIGGPAPGVDMSIDDISDIYPRVCANLGDVALALQMDDTYFDPVHASVLAALASVVRGAVRGNLRGQRGWSGGSSSSSSSMPGAPQRDLSSDEVLDDEILSGTRGLTVGGYIAIPAEFLGGSSTAPAASAPPQGWDNAGPSSRGGAGGRGAAAQQSAQQVNSFAAGRESRENAAFSDLLRLVVAAVSDASTPFYIANIGEDQVLDMLERYFKVRVSPTGHGSQRTTLLRFSGDGASILVSVSILLRPCNSLTWLRYCLPVDFVGSFNAMTMGNPDGSSLPPMAITAMSAEERLDIETHAGRVFTAMHHGVELAERRLAAMLVNRRQLLAARATTIARRTEVLRVAEGEEEGNVDEANAELAALASRQDAQESKLRSVDKNLNAMRQAGHADLVARQTAAVAAMSNEQFAAYMSRHTDVVNFSNPPPFMRDGVMHVVDPDDDNEALFGVFADELEEHERRQPAQLNGHREVPFTMKWVQEHAVAHALRAGLHPESVETHVALNGHRLARVSHAMENAFAVWVAMGRGGSRADAAGVARRAVEALCMFFVRLARMEDGMTYVIAPEPHVSTILSLRGVTVAFVRTMSSGDPRLVAIDAERQFKSLCAYVCDMIRATLGANIRTLSAGMPPQQNADPARVTAYGAHWLASNTPMPLVSYVREMACDAFPLIGAQVAAAPSASSSSSAAVVAGGSSSSSSSSHAPMEME